MTGKESQRCPKIKMWVPGVLSEEQRIRKLGRCVLPVNHEGEHSLVAQYEKEQKEQENAG